jgi:hypothetical protein
METIIKTRMIGSHLLPDPICCPKHELKGLAILSFTKG